jgi:chromosome segregation ATPase
VVLLLATVGIIGCVAAIVGIWMFHQSGCEKAEKITTRFEGGLQRASVAHQNVQRALEQARASVDEVSKESTALTGREEKTRRSASAVRKLIRQQVGPNIDNLGVRLATLSDAAAAISSLLESLQESVPFQSGRLRADRMEGWTDQAVQLSAALRRLEAVVDNGDKESNEREVDAASSAVSLALQRCQEKVDEWQAQLEEAREGVRHIRREILGWWTLAAIMGSFLCGWVALGQVSLLVHVVQWWRGGTE